MLAMVSTLPSLKKITHRLLEPILLIIYKYEKIADISHII